MTSPDTSRNWSSFPSPGTTVTERLGPFPYRPFLEAVWDHRTDLDGDLVVVSEGPNAVALQISATNISFVGQENLTDYHSPVGPSFGSLLGDVLADHGGRSYRFDSMPKEVADVVSETLVRLGAPHTAVQHEATAVVDLPPSFDTWLMGLAKKERHEVRRKRRKLEGEFGPATIEIMGTGAVGPFCEMHRTSSGDKGRFMTPGMERFFADLVTHAGASIHGLMCDGVMRAAAIGFETDAGYFYYNSAYDIEAASASPGVVLVTSMIEAQIERGAEVFDFLKGDQRYKFRLGARSRPLYVIEGHLP